MKKIISVKLIISILSLILLITAYTGALDKSGLNYTEKTLTRALIVFGIARGINGVISVAQGTSMATWSCSNMPPGNGGAPGHPKGRETAPTHTTLRAHHLTCFRSEHRPVSLDARHSSPRSRPSHPTTMNPCSHMSHRPLGDTRPPPKA